MTMGSVRGKVALSYFGPQDGYFGDIFWDMDFQLVLPNIHINFDIQTKFEVNQTQIGHSIPKKLQKLTKVAISQNPICPSVIHQKAYSSYIFQWICLKLSESMYIWILHILIMADFWFRPPKIWAQNPKKAGPLWWVLQYFWVWLTLNLVCISKLM